MPKSRSRRPQQRRPQQSRRPAAPPVPTPTAPGLRGQVERASTPVLAWFATRPKALLPVLSLALLASGFLAPRVIAVPALVVLLGIVTWLTYLSWPAVEGGAKVLRIATLLLLVVAIGTTAVGS